MYLARGNSAACLSIAFFFSGPFSLRSVVLSLCVHPSFLHTHAHTHTHAYTRTHTHTHTPSSIFVSSILLAWPHQLLRMGAAQSAHGWSQRTSLARTWTEHDFLGEREGKEEENEKRERGGGQTNSSVNISVSLFPSLPSPLVLALLEDTSGGRPPLMRRSVEDGARGNRRC